MVFGTTVILTLLYLYHAALARSHSFELVIDVSVVRPVVSEGLFIMVAKGYAHNSRKVIQR